VAQDLMNGAGQKAMIGRLLDEDSGGRVINAGTVFQQLKRKLNKELPLTAPQKTKNEEGEGNGERADNNRSVTWCGCGRSGDWNGGECRHHRGAAPKPEICGRAHGRAPATRLPHGREYRGSQRARNAGRAPQGRCPQAGGTSPRAGVRTHGAGRSSERKGAGEVGPRIPV